MASRTATDLIIFGAVGALEEKGERSYHISPEHPISEAKFLKSDNTTHQLTVGGRVDYLIASARSVELPGRTSRDCNDVIHLTSFALTH